MKSALVNSGSKFTVARLEQWWDLFLRKSSPIDRFEERALLEPGRVAMCTKAVLRVLIMELQMKPN